jgi:exodeoxyribonuclease V gamma subunit
MDDEEYGPLARYLADGRPLKRVQLAMRLASLFDQYLVYRPEMVTRWEQAPNLKTGRPASGAA